MQEKSENPINHKRLLSRAKCTIKGANQYKNMLCRGWEKKTHHGDISFPINNNHSVHPAHGTGKTF